MPLQASPYPAHPRANVLAMIMCALHDHEDPIEPSVLLAEVKKKLPHEIDSTIEHEIVSNGDYWRVSQGRVWLNPIFRGLFK